MWFRCRYVITLLSPPQVPINPKEKSFQRFLKRHSAKVEVFQKGGFLRSDALIGTAKVELAPLEGRCTVHDRYIVAHKKCPC